MRSQIRRARRFWQWAVALAAILSTALAPAAVVEATGLTEEQTAAMERLVTQVSELRELPVLHPLSVNVMTIEELQSVLRREIDRQLSPERAEGQILALQTLGLIPPGYDLRAGYEAMLTEQIGGLYDEEESTLHIMEWINIGSTTAQIILAHEITHALQDQSFDLGGSPITSTENDDRALAALAVIEGDATVTMSVWAAEHAGVGFLFEMTQLVQMDQSALVSAPPFITQQLLFPYLMGQAFVMPVSMGPSGWGGVDDLMRDWPESTEQILHPERSSLHPESVDRPTTVAIDASVWGVPEDWTLLESNVAGELTIRHVFIPSLRQRRASQMADGWDGDRFSVLRDAESGSTAMLGSTVWDSEEDAEEFASALDGLWERIDLTGVIDTAGRTAYASPEVAVECVGSTVHLAVWDASSGITIDLPGESIERVD